MRVIAAFRDRNTGHLVNPGDPVPEGLDRETISRLIKARCLSAEPVSPPNAGRAVLQPPNANRAPATKSKRKASAKRKPKADGGNSTAK